MVGASMNGAWRGTWRQGRRVGHEELILAFAQGCVQGSGLDEDGAFDLCGTIYADGTVSLTKRYTHSLIANPPLMSYLGHWDGSRAQGIWLEDAHPDNHGPFLLWPHRPPKQAEAEVKRGVSPKIIYDAPSPEG